MKASKHIRRLACVVSKGVLEFTVYKYFVVIPTKLGISYTYTI